MKARETIALPPRNSWAPLTNSVEEICINSPIRQLVEFIPLREKSVVVSRWNFSSRPGKGVLISLALGWNPAQEASWYEFDGDQAPPEGRHRGFRLLTYRMFQAVICQGTIGVAVLGFTSLRVGVRGDADGVGGGVKANTTRSHAIGY